ETRGCQHRQDDLLPRRRFGKTSPRYCRHLKGQRRGSRPDVCRAMGGRSRPRRNMEGHLAAGRLDSLDEAMTPDLPDVQNLLRISKAIAVLDAILSPDWQYRYYSFNSRWAAGKQMASMRNGEGDHYFILFSQHGAILKGYA